MSDVPRLLGGRYEVGELIGRGGMAEVHLGHDTRLGRSVAIKMLRADLARDSTFLTRFRREAKSAAGLNHHAIVAVYDSGEETIVETGGAELPVPYIVMEYVDGETLRDVLNAEGHLSPDEAARITQGVLSALEYSHERGIVHRDIKPANVMLTRGGQVKVMDFGIARALADVGATMTSAQAVVGTARYLSPEQAKGDSVDPRTDLYSAGCVFYELLCGRTPFVGEPVSLVYQHISDTPAPPSIYEQSVPTDMDAVALHALEKPRDDRYQTAAEFRADLQAARTHSPLSAAAMASLAAAGGAAAAARKEAVASEPVRRDSTREIQDRHQRSNNTGLWVVAAIAALLAILGIGYLLMNGSNEPKLAKVPGVQGQTQAAADQALRDAKFVPRFVQVTSDETQGNVVGQSPKAGVEAKEGSTVTVNVSAGPGTKVVPDVTGKTVDQAKQILAENGFANVQEDPNPQDDTQYQAGQVSGTSPGANTTQKPTTVIKLLVSSGKVTVPDGLSGLTYGEAYAKLTSAHLKVAQSTSPVFTTDRNLAGHVKLTAPQSGDKVDVDSTVTLTMYEYQSTVTTTIEPPSPTSSTDSPSTGPSSSSSSPSSSSTSSSSAPTSSSTPPASK